MNLSGSSKIKFLIVYLMVYLVVKAMGNYGIFVLLQGIIRRKKMFMGLFWAYEQYPENNEVKQEEWEVEKEKRNKITPCNLL